MSEFFTDPGRNRVTLSVDSSYLIDSKMVF